MSETDVIDMRGVKYESHLKWLKDARFVKELQGDNIDCDVIEEELTSLKHLENPLTQREKVVKFLRSNPVQIILCVFVLLDASIVVSQILLDINSVKERLHAREQQFKKLWTFLQDEGDFNHAKKHYRVHRGPTSADQTLHQSAGLSLDRSSDGFTRDNKGSSGTSPRRHVIKRGFLPPETKIGGDSETLASGSDRLKEESKEELKKELNEEIKRESTEKSKEESKSLLVSIRPDEILCPWKNKISSIGGTSSKEKPRKETKETERTSDKRPSPSPRQKRQISNLANQFVLLQKESPSPIDFVEGDVASRNSFLTGSNFSNQSVAKRPRVPSGHPKHSKKREVTEEAGNPADASNNVDLFKRAAHILHHISIAILAFLVFEDLVRLVALGRSICHHKIEIFDTMLICASFAVGVFYLGGVTGDDGQQAVVALFVLLVWRVARAVDGIIMTVKQRQEFRIRLQRRVRRKAEKLLEAAESEKSSEIQHLEALQELCLKAGVKQEDILSICNLKGQKRLSWMLHALSTVARLSVGMSIFPSFGLYRHVSDWCLNVSPGRKYSRMVQQSKSRLPSPQSHPQSRDRKRKGSCSMAEETSRSYLGLPKKYFTNQELSSLGERRLSDLLMVTSSDAAAPPSTSESRMERRRENMGRQVACNNNNNNNNNSISGEENLNLANRFGSNSDGRSTQSKRSNGSSKVPLNIYEKGNQKKKSFKIRNFFKEQKNKKTKRTSTEIFTSEPVGDPSSEVDEKKI